MFKLIFYFPYVYFNEWIIPYKKKINKQWAFCFIELWQTIRVNKFKFLHTSFVSISTWKMTYYLLTSNHFVFRNWLIFSELNWIQAAIITSNLDLSWLQYSCCAVFFLCFLFFFGFTLAPSACIHLFIVEIVIVFQLSTTTFDVDFDSNSIPFAHCFLLKN